MLNLNLPTENYWIELAGDIRFHVKPLTSMIVQTARAVAGHKLRDLLKSRKDMLEVGATVADFPDLDDAGNVDALTHVLFVKAVAQACVIDYAGSIEDQDGNPLPFSVAAVQAILDHPQLFDQFWLEISRPLTSLATEKKIVLNLPNGLPKVVTAIAADANPPLDATIAN